MKKLLVILAVVLMLIGCGSKTDNKDNIAVYKSAVTAMQSESVGAIDAKIEMTMPKIGAFEEQLAMLPDGVVTMEIATIGDPTKANEYKAHINANLGILSMEMYVNEGFMYSSIFGMKIKAPFASDTDLSNYDTSNYSEMMPDSDELLKKFTITEKDGVIKYELALNSKEEILDFVNEFNSSTPIGSLEDGVVDYTKLILEIEIDAATEKVKKFNYTFGIKDIESGETGDMVMTMTLNSYGKDVKIEFPDFSDYVEAPGS